MTIPTQFQAFVIHGTKEAEGLEIQSEISSLPIGLLDGEVLVQIEFSAVNYKDALAAQGNPGVARTFPLIPGIDAVGSVVESSSDEFKTGEKVFIAHAKFGTAAHGGWAEFARVPADWVYKIPSDASGDEFSTKESAIWGTAGFTAAQSVEQVVDHAIKPDDGPVVVTGATGGVGIFAVKLLAKLGYEVVASTGKLDKTDWLKQNGANDVISRSELEETSSAPLLKGRWAAAIDTVGGHTLSNVLRTCKPHACVTACGLVGGSQLETSVFPFILRGITLCGIDSANISRVTRIALWAKIATQWRLENLEDLAEEVSMGELPSVVTRILQGRVFGRTLLAH